MSAAPGTPLLAQGLRVRLGQQQALDGVDLRFQAGEWCAVVGPNGAGKSTLLGVLAGLRQPDAGLVHLQGRPLADWRSRERARQLAWLSQQGEADGEIPVRDVVRLGRLPHHSLFGARGPADDQAVCWAMAETECTAFADRRLSELSGGERQRVLLARALAVQARVLLLDEPTTHLDPPHQVALARLCRRLGSTHTVVTVLHDLPLALQADRVLLLRAGRVAADAVFDDPALHAALVATFGGAIRIDSSGRRPVVMPHLED